MIIIAVYIADITRAVEKKGSADINRANNA
jgi:hypothetical protein